MNVFQQGKMAHGDAIKTVSFTKINAETSQPNPHTTFLVEFIFTCPPANTRLFRKPELEKSGHISQITVTIN